MPSMHSAERGRELSEPSPIVNSSSSTQAPCRSRLHDVDIQEAGSSPRDDKLLILVSYLPIPESLFRP